MLKPWIFLAIDICMFLRTVLSANVSDGSSDCFANLFKTLSAWWNRSVISRVFWSMSRSLCSSLVEKSTISLLVCRAASSRTAAERRIRTSAKRIIKTRSVQQTYSLFESSIRPLRLVQFGRPTPEAVCSSRTCSQLAAKDNSISSHLYNITAIVNTRKRPSSESPFVTRWRFAFAPFRKSINLLVRFLVAIVLRNNVQNLQANDQISQVSVAAFRPSDTAHEPACCSGVPTVNKIDRSEHCIK
jgi:hypothetical protein